MSSFKRIIFCLYFQDNNFYLSRNFRLQKVGDLNWLIQNFGFGVTANYIDELVILLVKKNPSEEDYRNFVMMLENLRKKIFIPIVIGGNIRNIKIANTYFKSGADKILINSAAYSNKKLIEEITKYYGSQSVSIMVDYKKIDNKVFLYSNYGTKLISTEFKQHIEDLNNLNCGEIILNSIDNDGNGAGLDNLILEEIPNGITKPLLLMGGAGKPEHILLGLKNKDIFGVVTANLFNFLGTGLKDSRNYCLSKKINLAYFEILK